MCTVAYGEVIRTAIQNPCTECTIRILVGHIIRRNILHIGIQPQILAFIRRQLFCLIIGKQLDGRFFQSSLNIRSLSVKLDIASSGRIACIRYPNSKFERKLMLPGNHFRLSDQFFLKSGVIQPVSETIADFTCIIPVSVRCDSAFCRVCVMNTVYTIVIPGLIIAIAGINVLSFNRIRSKSVVSCLARYGVFIGKYESADIHHPGMREILSGINIRHTARRAYSSAQYIGNTEGAVVSGMPYPENGINSFVVFQFVDFHGGGRIDQYDNPIKLFARQIDDISFIRSEFQRLCSSRARCCTTYQIVFSFSAWTSHNHYCCI